MNCFNRGKLILIDEESGRCYSADTISVGMGIYAGITSDIRTPYNSVPYAITAECTSIVQYDTKLNPKLKNVIFNELFGDTSNNFRKQHGIAMKRKRRRKNGQD